MSLPSCLVMVNRVLEECGDITVSSLNPGTRNSKIALEGLNDAQSQVWKGYTWPWQKQTYNVKLVAGQSDYAMPDRFNRMALPLRFGASGSFKQLQEWTEEEWVNQGMGVPTTAGTPQNYKVSPTTLTMTPAPSSDFVTTYPTLVFDYFQDIPPRRGVTDDSNSFDCPDEFYDTMILFGKSRLKQYLGAPDWQVDMQQFQQNMKGHLAQYLKYRGPARVRPKNYIVSEW